MPTFLKFIIIWIFIGLAVYGLYWVQRSDSGVKSKEATFKLPFGLGYQIKKVNFPPESSAEPLKLSAPIVQDEEDGLVNVALNKPVIYLSDLIPIELERYYYERYSVNTTRYPNNLTDGNPETAACPGHWAFDYVIDLQEVYNIKKIKLVWGSFGISEKHTYITKWKLLSQQKVTGNKELNPDDWTLVKEGDSPDALVTTIDKTVSARRFRIMAISAEIEGRTLKLENWIGIHEFKAYASI